jgi:DNA-binding PadR family transcriptional regulator
LTYYVGRSKVPTVSSSPSHSAAGGGRSNDPALLILTSLAAEAKHGYALLLDIESFAGIRLGPGTLYGAISRLESRGLIEPLAGSGRRRPYRLTARGAEALEVALADLRVILDTGTARLSSRPPGRIVPRGAPA